MLAGVLVVVVALTLECCSGNHRCSSENSLQLYNSYGDTSTQGGMVQVCRSNIWRAVCNIGWGCNEGRAACKQLGYGGSYLRVAPISSSTRYFGSWSYYDYYYYSCSSSSTSLTSCSRYYSPYYCSHSTYRAGLWCMNSSTEYPSANGAVRLVGGKSSREGRLEYCDHGVWFPFCSLSIQTATVACKQLGFNLPKVAVFTDGRFGILSKYSSFSSINCLDYSTLPSSLTSCSLSSCGSRCSTNDGIRCYESGYDGCTNGAVRLVNSTIEYEGRVEVCYDGIWGTVCGVGILDAIVICNTLGYGGVSAIYSSSQFGDGERPIVYRFNCNGFEDNIQLCSNSGYRGFLCSRQSVSGVKCHYGCTDGDVRLVGGSTAAEGTVEVCLNKRWGLVSGLGWGEEEAHVVCRQLKLKADGSVSYTGTPFGISNITVHYSIVHCTGSETRLTNCAANKLTFKEGKQLAARISVAGVSCNTLPATPLVCPTSHCLPQGSQQARPGWLSESGHTLTIFLLTGLSVILGTMTVALGAGLCYMTYKNGKLKERVRTNGQTSNTGSHVISTAPTIMNACYKTPSTTAFQGMQNRKQEAYANVDIK